MPREQTRVSRSETGSEGERSGARASRRAPVGTRDVLYPESARWEVVLSLFAGIVERAGYGLLVSPVFEDVGVFSRGMGETADVVTKEMYVFEDRSGRTLALRPEGTASVVRAFVQHRPPVPWKAWYATPAFRYERPQAGRFRQHHQVGVEAIGSADPDLDVEVIGLAAGFLSTCGLRQVELRINTMGDEHCAPAYRDQLASYLASRRAELCGEHRDRALANPLRVLDCKTDECRAASAGAPRLVDAACPECKAHLARVQEGLSATGISAIVDHRLVRGFDYYTRTTFELAAPALAAAQNGVGGGGRYDRLVEVLGGPASPGIGFAVGVERLLLACDAEGCLPANGSGPGPAPAAFVVDVTGGEAARDLTHELRAAGIASDRAFDARSLKAQMRAANRSGAGLALIVGEDEAGSGTVSLRMLRAANGSRGPAPGQERGQEEDGDGSQGQVEVPRAEVVRRVRELLDR